MGSLVSCRMLTEQVAPSAAKPKVAKVTCLDAHPVLTETDFINLGAIRESKST